MLYSYVLKLCFTKHFGASRILPKAGNKKNIKLEWITYIFRIIPLTK